MNKTTTTNLIIPASALKGGNIQIIIRGGKASFTTPATLKQTKVSEGKNPVGRPRTRMVKNFRFIKDGSTYRLLGAGRPPINKDIIVRELPWNFNKKTLSEAEALAK